MTLKLKLALGMSVLLTAPAMALDVYPGCEVPTTVAGRRTFFVDPVKGSNGGDGSAARPWKDLNTVFAPGSKLIATKSHKTPSGSPLLAVNPNAPIKGGDVIMLMSGDFGDVTLMNAFNDRFITVTAAPGQRPIIQHLKVAGGARWLFQGLTFQSEYPSGAKQNANTQVTVRDGWGDPTTNIILDNVTFQSTPDSSRWSDADWYSKPNFMALGTNATCFATTNSTFVNILNGISVNGPQTLIKNNTFRKFSNDAIDVIASNVTIFGNSMADGMYNGTSSLHPDSIQVWSNPTNGKMTNANKNIVIDSNKIYMAKSVDGVRGTLQGITIGSFDNVTIQNNVIATNMWNAIYGNGLRNGRIINNTIASTDPVGHQSRIYVGPTVYYSSSNILIRNNIAPFISAEDPNLTMDHNVTSFNYTTKPAGKVVWHPNGIVDSKNLIRPTMTSAFRNWDPSTGGNDLHLKPVGQLDNIGTPLLAPTKDADGKPRGSSVDVGAYAR